MKKMMSRWFLVLVVVLSMVADSWANYTEIVATADTWINGIGPDSNYSGLNYLWIGPNKSGLVKIDLTGQVPAGQVISSAYLDVFITYVSSNCAVDLYQQTDAWV